MQDVTVDLEMGRIGSGATRVSGSAQGTARIFAPRVPLGLRVLRGLHDRATQYRFLARRVLGRLAVDRSCPDWLLAAAGAWAPSPCHRALLADLREALAAGDIARARSVATTAAFRQDLRAEKLVSHRYRFVWLCNPKVASRSLIAALREADPDAVLIRERTLGEITQVWPKTRHYVTFAFVRSPYMRAHSFYADKILSLYRERDRVIDRHHGIGPGTSFDDLCAWLNTPYGADAVGERHWLSQNVLIRRPDGRLPDFVGRYERLQADLDIIASHVGMPAPRLPVINAKTGWDPVPSREEREVRRRATDLRERNRDLLRRRYATDFELFRYPP